MFSFLNPLFLWAAAAAVIPLLLHLLQRRRIVRVPFSTLRFLRLAERRSSRRLRLENLLLWLLRTALMLLLALAFAMPVLRTRALAGVLGRARRDVAIVLDGSYSMRYQLGRETAWEKALAAAAAVIQGLDEGDRVCVFTAADQVEPVIEQLTADREFAVARLKALPAGRTSSQLCPALLDANAALAADDRRREREIHILTDGQAVPWQEFGAPPPAGAPTNGAAPAAASPRPGAPATAWDPRRIDRRTTVFVTLTGAAEPHNSAPVAVQVRPGVVLATAASRVEVRCRGAGLETDGTATLVVDGRELGRQTVAFDDAGGGLAAFAVPPLPPGTHAARVETQPDNLPFDDAFHFLIRSRAELPVLCVGRADDTLFLRKALAIGPAAESALRPKALAAEDLAGESLGDYSAVFLCNALPLPAQAVLQLEDYAKAGGLLVVFPGDRATPADYRAWSCLPAPPAAVRDLPDSAQTQVLRWPTAAHDLLDPLRPAAGAAAVLAIHRHLAWTDLPPHAKVLLMAGADQPFLLERELAGGRVLLFAVSADRGWSRLPLSPYFLPLVHEIVRYAAGAAGETPFRWTTRSLALAAALPGFPADGELLAPDHAPVAVRRAAEQGRSGLVAEALLDPGLYYRADAGGAEPLPVLALNAERFESDLTPLEARRLPDLLKLPRLQIAETPEALPKLIHEQRMGRTLGETALWLALLVALAEVIYANYKARTPPDLSAALGVEASGRVRSKAHDAV